MEIRRIRNSYDMGVRGAPGWKSYNGPAMAERYCCSKQNVDNIRKRVVRNRVSDMPEPDEYYVMDAAEFLECFPSGSLSGVVTSPPYNKAFKGRGKNANRARTNWVNSKLMLGDYGEYDDNLPEAEYVAWQRRFLEAALRAVGDDGVVLYNMGRRIKNLREDRRQSIVDRFPLRQTIIWDRGSSNNMGGVRPTILPPKYELIYVIADNKWRPPEKYLSEFRKWGDVWRIPFEVNNPHPAPFPVVLAERMVKLVGGAVADPFAGSGTVGVAAERVGCAYYLNDMHEPYREMFLERRARLHEERAGAQCQHQDGAELSEVTVPSRHVPGSVQTC